MIRAHEAKGVFYCFGNNLLNLALKRNTEDESEFVRIMKNEAKAFVKTIYIRVLLSKTFSSPESPLLERRWRN